MAETPWKDISSRSRDEPAGSAPTIVEARVGPLRVIVHRHICEAPDAWLVSCHELNVERRLLRSKDLERAKSEALVRLLATSQQATDALKKAIDGSKKRRPATK